MSCTHYQLGGGGGGVAVQRQLLWKCYLVGISRRHWLLYRCVSLSELKSLYPLPEQTFANSLVTLMISSIHTIYGSGAFDVFRGDWVD